jgi:hypothetical protein
MTCPICGGPTRIHDTYLMCDQCERLVGMAPDAVLNKPSARERTPPRLPKVDNPRDKGHHHDNQR